MSEVEKIVNDFESAAISGWINKGCFFALRVLYSSKQDGVSARAFHSLSDSKGPTVTVVKFKNGAKVGGYVSQQWMARQALVSDANAFLFMLTNDAGKPKPTMFKCTNAANAIHDMTNGGPTFGNGPDLALFSEEALNVSSKQSAFAISTEFVNLVNSQKTNVEEVQVYEATSVFDFTETSKLASDASDASAAPIVFSEEERTARRERLQNFKFQYADKLGFSWANIVLAGHVGAGKSSLFNTWQACDAAKLYLSATAGTGTNSVTKLLQKRFTSLDLQRFPVSLWDTMGWGDNLSQFIDKFSLILEGNIARNTDLAAPFTTRSSSFISSPSFTDRAHVVLLVASAVDATDAHYLELLREAKEVAMRGREIAVRVLLVLTHVDEFDPSLRGDGLSQIYNSQKLKKLTESVSRGTGISESRIFPVRCYSRETEPNLHIDIVAMKALESILVQIQGMLLDLYDDFLHNQPQKTNDVAKKTQDPADVS
eukprot:ANDGO_03963.mRNA.1 hypothetical protein AURANDRAFT_35515